MVALQIGAQEIGTAASAVPTTSRPATNASSVMRRRGVGATAEGAVATVEATVEAMVAAAAVATAAV